MQKILLLFFITLIFSSCINETINPEDVGNNLIFTVRAENDQGDILPAFEVLDYLKLWIFCPNKTESYSVVLSKLSKEEFSGKYDIEDFKLISSSYYTGVQFKETKFFFNLKASELNNYILEDVPDNASYLAIGVPDDDNYYYDKFYDKYKLRNGYNVEFVNIKGDIKDYKGYRIEKDIILNQREPLSKIIRVVPEMFGVKRLDFISIASEFDWEQYDKEYEMIRNEDGFYEYEFKDVRPGSFIYMLNPVSENIDWGIQEGWAEDPTADSFQPVAGVDGEKFYSVCNIALPDYAKYEPVISIRIHNDKDDISIYYDVNTSLLDYRYTELRIKLEIYNDDMERIQFNQIFESPTEELLFYFDYNTNALGIYLDNYQGKKIFKFTITDPNGNEYIKEIEKILE